MTEFFHCAQGFGLGQQIAEVVRNIHVCEIHPKEPGHFVAKVCSAGFITQVGYDDGIYLPRPVEHHLYPVQREDDCWLVSGQSALGHHFFHLQDLGVASNHQPNTISRYSVQFFGRFLIDERISGGEVVKVHFLASAGPDASQGGQRGGINAGYPHAAFPSEVPHVNRWNFFSYAGSQPVDYFQVSEICLKFLKTTVGEIWAAAEAVLGGGAGENDDFVDGTQGVYRLRPDGKIDGITGTESRRHD